MPSKPTTTLSEPSLALPVRWIPAAYAKKAVKFLLTHGAGGLFLPPGLGKTAITLAALKLLFKQDHVKKVLVVAPLRVCFSTWPGEMEKWLDFNGFTHTVLHGSKKDELLLEDTQFHIINPEGLDWLLQTTKTKNPRTNKTSVDVDVRRFKRLGYDVLVLDELTKFKNHNSDRWKALKKVLGTFGRRWGLTGSPAANGLEPLFGQCYCMDEGRTLGKFITHYRNKYFHQHPNGFTYEINEGADDLIYERLNPLVLRINEDDAGLELPELVVHDIWVDLPEDAMRSYLSMEDHLITVIEQELQVAKNKGVALGKCLQMASGAIYKTPDVTQLIKLKPSKREWSLLHDEKLLALEDLVDSLQGKPLLVTYEFGHDYERLKAAFPEATFVTEVKPSKFKEVEDAWNRGELPLVFAQSSSISHGLNLQGHGNHIAMFGCTWDFEVYDQAIRRLKRQGQKAKRIFLHRILARDTADQAVIVKLDKKEKGQNALFDALVKLRKSRKKRAFSTL